MRIGVIEVGNAFALRFLAHTYVQISLTFEISAYIQSYGH